LATRDNNICAARSVYEKMVSPLSEPTRRMSTRIRRVSYDNASETGKKRPSSTTRTDDDTTHQPVITPHDKTSLFVAAESTKDKNALITPTSKEFEEVKSSDSIYPFNGVNYPTYQDMVNAKRQRNQQVLEQSGLLSTASVLYSTSGRRKDPSSRTTVAATNHRGIKSQRTNDNENKSGHGGATELFNKRRKSNRLQGIESDGLYVDEERAGKVTVVVAGGSIAKTRTYMQSDSNTVSSESNDDNKTYRNRINDGEAISLSEAIEYAGKKWMTDYSITNAESFVRNTLLAAPSSKTDDNIQVSNSSIHPSDDSYSYDTKLLEGLDCEDVHRNVAKLCPDRIYSMAVHPSNDNLIVCAGDKSGHVGIWHVQDSNDVLPTTTNPSEVDHVHLFKPHNGAVCCLQWTAPTTSSTQCCNNLMTASYDGTIRLFDAEKEQFVEIFATYDTDPKYSERYGYGLEKYGNKFWTQSICLDPRWNNSQCCFLSTSIGTAMHIDLRTKQHITFHEELSEKKINTLRYAFLPLVPSSD
jgi:hypothetical protein